MPDKVADRPLTQPVVVPAAVDLGDPCGEEGGGRSERRTGRGLA
ncbi:MAG: hypothetical protein WKF83_12980 [Nocardioidaceae bacterium]